MTIQNKRIFASILFVLISFVCVAQGQLPPPGLPPPPPGLPIDGGVIFGVVVAIFYGVRKILVFRKLK
ncbi:hypothetical protein BWZ22_06615 [Seonamhaeicola sp. S2-3]|uniref:PID-CTERM protein-sorting domain-containing protein n=1 Tax=Seonamhaeicola sp. S2-3 TaxID=1936081 RepID=UPI0009729ED1|nr:hypothetical protein [Seonamhaeicola sp. S2-3]APY10931.1 hypothetical protein BWZ22_06615 [Seonamhaeicola sp. S2-3]